MNSTFVYVLAGIGLAIIFQAVIWLSVIAMLPTDPPHKNDRQQWPGKSSERVADALETLLDHGWRHETFWDGYAEWRNPADGRQVTLPLDDTRDDFYPLMTALFAEVNK